MRKYILIFLIMLIPLVIATPDLDVKKINEKDVVVKELDNSALFDLVIINNGQTDEFEIYSLVSVDILPKGFTKINQSEEILINIAARPRDVLREPGILIFEYEIQGKKTGIFKDTLEVKIVELNKVIEFKMENIGSEDEIGVTIRNKRNTLIENVPVRFESAFFNEKRIVSLQPFGSETFNIGIDPEIGGLEAGSYVVSLIFESNEGDVKLEGLTKYLEVENIKEFEESSGWIIQENRKGKLNEGNIASDVKITLTRDVISRLFTRFSTKPDSVERAGLFVEYSWKKNIRPGESFLVNYTTNYSIPFILLLFVIGVGVFVKVYSRKDFSINKSVSLVRTKGGEFALKVRVRVRARKNVSAVVLFDRIPGNMKLYEKYGVQPNINEKTRQISWNLKSMSVGQEKIISYIVYSNLKVFGRFELPSALARFEIDGKDEEVYSNRAFFVGDTAGE